MPLPFLAQAGIGLAGSLVANEIAGDTPEPDFVTPVLQTGRRRLDEASERGERRFEEASGDLAAAGLTGSAVSEPLRLLGEQTRRDVTAIDDSVGDAINAARRRESIARYQTRVRERQNRIATLSRVGQASQALAGILGGGDATNASPEAGEGLLSNFQLDPDTFRPAIGDIFA